jgi:hypothetical protein
MPPQAELPLEAVVVGEGGDEALRELGHWCWKDAALGPEGEREQGERETGERGSEPATSVRGPSWPGTATRREYPAHGTRIPP